jgi:hypothetical protein
MNKLQLIQSTLINNLINLANNDSGVESYLLERHNLTGDVITVEKLTNCELEDLVEDCVGFGVTTDVADDYEQIVVVLDLVDKQEVDITDHYYDCYGRLIEDMVEE